MLKGDIIDGLFAPLHGVLWEKVQHFLICAFDKTLVNGDPCKQSHHPLSDRHYIYSTVNLKTVPIVAVYHLTVSDSAYLTDIALVSRAFFYILMKFVLCHNIPPTISSVYSIEVSYSIYIVSNQIFNVNRYFKII